MKITFHGHCPSWIASAVGRTAGNSGAGSAALQESDVATPKSWNLGVFKVKFHRKASPLETSLRALAKQPTERISNVTGGVPVPQQFAQASTTKSEDPPSHDIQAYIDEQLGPDARQSSHTERGLRPQSPNEYLSHWNAWAQKGGAEWENRTEAVSRMQQWLNQSQPHKTLDLSALGLTSLPDHLPASLRSLDISNNQIIRLPRENPAALRRIAVDPIHPRPNWIHRVQKIVVNPKSTEELQPSQAPPGKPGPNSADESPARSHNIYQRVEI